MQIEALPGALEEWATHANEIAARMRDLTCHSGRLGATIPDKSRGIKLNSWVPAL